MKTVFNLNDALAFYIDHPNQELKCVKPNGEIQIFKKFLQAREFYENVTLIKKAPVYEESFISVETDNDF